MIENHVELSRDAIIDAALNCASGIGWSKTKMQNITKELNTDITALNKFYDDKTDILIGYGRRIDKDVLNNISTFTKDDTNKDKLFEIFMERFDILNDNRDAVLSILSSFKNDPCTALTSLPHLNHSMGWMITAANIQISGIKGSIIVGAITLAYLNTVRVWMSDVSEDMSKTMAALDKNLDHLKHLERLF